MKSEFDDDYKTREIIEHKFNTLSLENKNSVRVSKSARPNCLKKYFSLTLN